MKPYVIITDSGSDLNAKMIADLGLDIVYLGAELNGTSFDVTNEHGIKAFYDGMREGLDTKTYAANTDQFIEVFEKHLKNGADLLYVGFSGGLSGTFGASVVAKNLLLEKYPDARIECIDTKCASLGGGLATYYAVQKKNSGADIDELAAFLTEFCPKIAHRFTVDDLKYLKRGGRISAATALIGTMLSIKPVLHVNDEGKLIPLKKARGRKNAISMLFEDMRAMAVDPTEHTVFISHADCIQDAEYLAELIKKELHPKDVVIGKIGPVIGAHSGPGTLALFFYAGER